MPPKKKSLAEQLADLSTATPVDYDPEDMGGDSFKANVDAGSDVESQGSGDDTAGREHYVSMGKSQLRSKQFLLDDPKYKGKKISRKAALSIGSDDEEEDDSEDDVMNEDDLDDDEDLMGNLHDDDDDDEEDDEEDEEDASDQEESEEIDDEEEGEDVDDDEDDDDNEDDEDEEDGYGTFSASGAGSTSKEMQEELQKIQAEEKALMQRMTKSVNEDVEKGMHVKSQLAIWETLLDTRIRLQKSVALVNTLPQPDVYEDHFMTNDSAEPQETAKVALRSFLDTLITVRTNLLRNLEGVTIPKANKRKLADLMAEDDESRREKLDDDAWEAKAWKDVEGLNEAWRSYRNNTLEKWSNKVQVASGIPLNKKFKAMNQGIMTQISQTMADEERLLKRTQLKRSEYHILGKPPSQNDESDEDPSVEKTPDSGRLDAHLSNHDEEIFDDTDFYQQLLRELIESRMVDNDDPTAMGMRWAALRQSKQSKKKVDTKASKGRRLRYHVHEKLQSFMAPAPAGTWHEEMTEELFSSLLGRKSELKDEDDEDEEEEDEVVPDDGMRIFG